MSRHLTPLQVCERLIAPVKGLGVRLGFHPKSAYAWREGSRLRGPGDMPARANRRALEVAERIGAPLVARHLIWGASEDEIEALEVALAQGIDAELLRATVAHGPDELLRSVILDAGACPEAAE